VSLPPLENQVATAFTVRLCRGAQEGRALEPIAAIGEPPARHADRHGRRQCPPERKREVGNHAQDSERGPKDFSFHDAILNLGPGDRKGNVPFIAWAPSRAHTRSRVADPRRGDPRFARLGRALPQVRQSSSQGYVTLRTALPWRAGYCSCGRATLKCSVALFAKAARRRVDRGGL
jgi:hypothetical protein